ncbi:exopolysaccharide production protein ExoF [Methylobacterium phyllostachyos]|uniref:Exopolysaccharide production protein ExoF n=1 Tax=Methylobacterium phyllostachyos TaxID=582672 RepID=A0A1H0I5D6_9HYPH|nr:polysaccharide biosynthesis/export family protein [Methylobacterium phyllostachyos]SDO26380.1 exopolysaccharide production protein ExoF [Methylobacterium phyllostachyos]
MTSWHRIVKACLFIYLLAIGCSAAQSAEQREYALGPQDKLQIRVFDLKPSTGEAYQWQAYNGEYVVGYDGSLSLPLIGNVKALGRSTTDLERVVSDELKDKVGLAKPPSVNVQIIRYRPVYVTGDVENPGEFDYRPNLTVLQALAIAGGVAKERDEETTSRRATRVTEGELRVLRAQQLGFLIKKARLAAEADGASTFKIPASVAGLSADYDVDKISASEQAVLDNHRSSQAAQVNLLTQARKTAIDEIASLQKKDETLQKQIDLSKRDLNQLGDLLSRGLTSTQRQLQAEQTLTTYESGRLDVLVTKLRTEQDVVRIDREMAELKNKYRSEALAQNLDVDAKLRETNEKIATAGLSISEGRRSRSGIQRNKGNAGLNFSIVRSTNSQATNVDTPETTTLNPGEVLIVERQPATLPPGLGDRTDADAPN